MKYLHKLFTVASAAFFIAGSALAQTSGTVTDHAFALGKGPGVAGYRSLLCASGTIPIGQAGADPICQTVSGDITISTAGVAAIGATKVTSAMLNADVFSTAHSWGGQQNFVTNYSVNGVVFGGAFTSGAIYNFINAPTGTIAFQAGDNTDPANYYKNNTHNFYDAASTKQFAQITTNGLSLFGTTSGSTRIAPVAAASGVWTLPAATDTFVGNALAATLTNKTLTVPSLTNPVITGASPNTAGQLGFTAGLINWFDGGQIRSAVASDATQTLTNKTFNCASNTCTVRLNTADVTGTLPKSNGGTGTTTISGALDTEFGSTQGNILYRGAAGWAALAPGTSGQFLQTLGAGANPGWASGGAGTGTVTGPATSTNTAVPRWSGAGGIALLDSGVLIDGSNNMTGIGTIGTTAHTVTSASASALAVGLNGATNPALKVDDSTASSATGVQIKSAAAAGGVGVSAISSGTNENLTIDAKGSGLISLNATGTGAITSPRQWQMNGGILISGLTGGGGFDATFNGATQNAVVLRSSSGGNSTMALFTVGGIVGSIVSTASATTYATSSDARLKESFRAFNSGSIIDRLTVGKFNWKKDGKEAYGVTAQAAYEVFPDAVTVGNDKAIDDPDFKPWQVDYSKFVPILLAEVQALRARVAKLERRR